MLLQVRLLKGPLGIRAEWVIVWDPMGIGFADPDFAPVQPADGRDELGASCLGRLPAGRLLLAWLSPNKASLGKGTCARHNTTYLSGTIDASAAVSTVCGILFPVAV